MRLVLFLLRLLGPRWGLTYAASDYIAAAGQLGRSDHIPARLVPIGGRLWARGLVNKRFLDTHRDWILPFWASHQLEPGDPGFVARGLQPVLLNSTYRDWTSIGNPSSSREAIVDPRGLVTPLFDGWSIDTWLYVDGRLYIPSRMDSIQVEQRLLENLPIIQTRYEAAGLRVVQEAFAVDYGTQQDWVVSAVTVENPTGAKRDVTVYLSSRPFNPEGVSLIKQVEFKPSGDAWAFWVNGVLGGYIPAPSITACSNDDNIDVASKIPELDGSMRGGSSAGVATAAAAYRMQLDPHSSRSLAGAMPMSQVDDPAFSTADWIGPGRIDLLRKRTQRRWRDLLDQGMSIRIPDERMQDAFDANKAYLLLLHDGETITPGPFTYHDFWFRDSAFMLNALDQLGYHEQVSQVLRTYPRRIQKDGYLLSQDGEWDANGQALWSMMEHTRLSGDLGLLADQYWQILNAAHWIDAKRQSTKDGESSPHRGLLPAGMSAEHLGPNDYYYWDDFWGLAGLRSAEYAARVFAKAKDEAKLRTAFEAFRADLDASLERVASLTGAAWMPASPYRGADSAMVANLVALYPLQLFPASDPRIVSTLQELKRIAWQEDAFFHHVGHSGFGTYLSLHIAGCLLYRRSAEAWPIILWVLSHATPTFTWAEAIHPVTRHGGMGDGHHGWAAADWISIMRNSLLFEEGAHLVLTPALPIEWAYESMSLQVERASTHFGVVGYTLAFGDHSATLVIKAAWREPPEYVEWNLPFVLKDAGGDRAGVQVLENRVRIPAEVRKVVATW